MKIKKRLPLFTILVTTLPVLLIIAIAIPLIVSTTTGIYMRQIDSMSTMLSKEIEDIHSDKISSLSYDAKNQLYVQVLEKGANKEEIKEIFEGQTSDVYLEGCVLLDKKGQVVVEYWFDSNYKPNDVITSYEKTEIFKTSLERGYTCENYVTKGGFPGLAVASSVKNKNGEIIGVRINFDNFRLVSSIISNLKIGETGYAYVVDGTGTVLVHKDQELVGNEFLNSINPDEGPELAAIVDLQKTGNLKEDGDFFKYKKDGKEIFANYKQLDTFNWLIVYAMDLGEIRSLPITLGIILAIVGILVITIGVVFGVIQTKKITKPLDIATENIKLLSREHIIRKIDYNKDDEFKYLFESLNKTSKLLNTQEEMLRFQAYHDALTGLKNRRAIFEKSSMLFGATKNDAILLLDLNNFKKLNDTRGHQEGDQVLVQIGKLLEKYESKNLFVGRIGGDEFLIFFTNVTDIEQITNLAEDIYEKIRVLKNKEGISFGVTASIGIAISNNRAYSIDYLFNLADDAMYKCKEGQKNGPQDVELKYHLVGL